MRLGSCSIVVLALVSSLPVFAQEVPAAPEDGGLLN
jgi:hypothetical protein